MPIRITRVYTRTGDRGETAFVPPGRPQWRPVARRSPDK